MVQCLTNSSWFFFLFSAMASGVARALYGSAWPSPYQPVSVLPSNRAVKPGGGLVVSWEWAGAQGRRRATVSAVRGVSRSMEDTSVSETAAEGKRRQSID